ncbi:hypothetical protein JOB18_008606 [Solea senegalensis]|uniref:Uncharacterized protein n=1 Tax=Solea senegalensis TaxID=28829 RepID=A0AAV6R3Y8_SOLSE|nr:hypothetical protein JOB18_008606 [Solea senegalensis]
MAAIVFPAVILGLCSPRNKSKTLLDMRAQAVWSSHSQHSCSLPLRVPVGAALRLRALRDEQTEHCARVQSGQTRLPLSLYPFYLHVQETGGHVGSTDLSHEQIHAIAVQNNSNNNNAIKEE